MQPDIQHWRDLSALLDALLALPDAEREAWIDALPAEKASYAPELKRSLDAARDLDRDEVILARPTMGEPTLAGIACEHDAAAHEGAEFGPYRLLRPIGRGGMGVVWLAERADGLLQRSVAIKLPVLSEGASRLVARFARERSILGALNHPHIARLYDAGVSADGQPYLVMEYVPGVSLVEYCDQARLSVEARLRLFLQVLSAVQHAHGLAIVHRDIKPSNILVTPEGEVRLLDFGIAKLIGEHEFASSDLTQLTGRALTQHYASPEQVQGGAVGIGTDVYSLGVVLYQLLTSRRPYALKTESRAELEQAITSAEALRPASFAFIDDEASARATTPKTLGRMLKGDLDAILLKALRKLPGERYLTAQAFAEDIERHLRGEVVTAQPVSTLYRARKFVARHQVAAALGAFAAASLLVGSGLALWQAHVARAERAVAQTAEKTARLEAARALAFKDFMTQVLQAGTGSAQGALQARDRTAQQILANAMRRLSADQTMSLSAKADVYSTISFIYTTFQLNGDALAAARSAMVATRAKPGGLVAADVVHLITLGELEATQDVQAAHALFVEADELFKLPDAAQFAQWRYSLDFVRSRTYREGDGNLEKSLLDGQRALAAWRANPQLPTDPPPVTVEWSVATNYLYLGRFAEAERTIADALSRHAGNAASDADRIPLYGTRIRLHEMLGRIAATEEAIAAAVEIAKAAGGGKDFPSALMLESMRSGLRAEYYGETVPVAKHDELIKRMRVSAGENNVLVPYMLRAQGSILIALGDAPAGVAKFRESARLLTPGNPTGREWVRHAIEVVPGLIALREFDEAERWLRQIAASGFVAQGPYGWTFTGHRIELALAKGDVNAAQQLWSTVKTGQTEPPADSPMSHRYALLGARISLAKGDATGAVTMAQSLSASLAQHPDRGAFRLTSARASMLEGEALLHLGRRAEAITRLGPAVRVLATRQLPQSALLAEARALLARAQRG